MKIGVAKEIKQDEYRVALTPAGARELTAHGHEVLVETTAGVGSAISDDHYRAAGATVVSVDEVWSAAEMVLKLRAALDARRDPDFVIVARTDSRAVEGIDAAISRANRYGQAGADVCFIEAPEGLDELQRIPREVKYPLCWAEGASGTTRR